MTQLTNARIAARISTKKSNHLNTTQSPWPYNGCAAYTSLVLVVLAGLLGPLLAAGKRFRVPVLVWSWSGGFILGRTWLHLVDPGAQPFPVFASLGFAMLMLESGTEIDLGSEVVRDMLASAQLGLPAAALGLATGLLRPAIAAALVAGGLLTLIPAIAGAILLAGAGPDKRDSGPPV
jgi:Kef-type K+ transport system membrane component KefB